MKDTTMKVLSRCLLFTFTVPVSVSVSAATFTVGVDPACTHATFASAVAAAAANGPESDEIHLVAAPGLLLSAPIMIDQQSLAITGGYASCDAVEPDTVTTYALVASDGFVIHGGMFDLHKTSIARLVIAGGADAGRLFAIDGLAEATLNDIDLSGGHATDGAGVYVFGPAVLTIGPNSRIHNNVATNRGGGIFVDAGATLSFSGTREPARLQDNTAAIGGGLAADGTSTTVELVNAMVSGNTASERGGGLDVANGATLTMGRLSADCPGEPICSYLVSNHADAPGAVGAGASARGGASLKIQQSELRDNTAADGGAAVDARDADTLAVIEGVFLLGHAPRPATYSASGAWLRAAYVSSYANSGGLFALGDGGRASVYSSVIQDTVFVLPQSGTATRFADCVTVKEATSIPPGLDLIDVQDDPVALFRNPVAGDLRPRPHAPSIDRCDDFYYSPTTLDVYGFARGFDVPSESTSPSFGTLDQGAVEASWLFADEFGG